MASLVSDGFERCGVGGEIDFLSSVQVLIHRGQLLNPFEKLSCCCDSRSYCMQQYERLKNSLLRDFCFLALFSVIAASRPVNKNVSTGAVIRAKPGTEPGVHKLLAKYQTGLGHKFRFTNGWCAIRFFWVEFRNAPKLCPFKRDQSSVVHEVSE